MISNRLIYKLMYILFVLFLVYLAFELARKVMGGSLGFEELAIGLLIANLGYSFYINSKLSKHICWHEGLDERKDAR